MILITGVAGFIGSHTAYKLLKLKKELVGIDNFDPYYSRQIKNYNLTQLLDFNSFKFVECDIRDKKTLFRILKKYPIEIVIHFAARPGVRPSFLNPKIYDEINVIGTLTLLEICSKLNIKKFIFASSSSVYGKNKIPFSENDYPLNPLSFYGCSKLNAEEICKFFTSRHNMHCWIFRLFSIYGPKLRPDLAIYKFTQAIVTGKKILLFDNGKYKRDFTYIDNVVEVFVKAISFFPSSYEIVNLGNSEPIQIKQLIKLLEQKLSKKAKIQSVSSSIKEVPITYANISKAEKIFSFNARFPISLGLDKFLGWFLSKKPNTLK
jgi:UDP-glucuronate 4-epimerase